MRRKGENNMKKDTKIIGILGGMGPQASARLVEMLIDMSVRDFGAKNGDDFPEIILDSVPVPEFISDSGKLKLVANMLKDRVRMLSNMNVSNFAIACNTAHILLDDLQSVSQVPFISIMDEIARRVSVEGIIKIGLLASPSTIRFGIFEKALSKSNVKVILPTQRQQIVLEKIIKRVISGSKLKSDSSQLSSIASSLGKRGAQGIILGCTELPLIFPRKFSVPIFDCLEILAKAILHKSFGGNKINS